MIEKVQEYTSRKKALLNEVVGQKNPYFYMLIKYTGSSILEQEALISK